MTENIKTGTIGVNIGDLFPLIKKFLYSNHEIFIREVVSNAVDAMTKMKAVASGSEPAIEGYSEDDLKVRVSLDEENGVLTVSDRGIGMTADEVEKYINQVAFSGMSDFIEKYKDTANTGIGHFGLGFYSTFMVGKTVEIVTRSYKEGSKTVHWTCAGTPEFQLEETNDEHQIGMDIIIHLNLEDEEIKNDFNSKDKIRDLLKKYCRFMPFPVIFGKKQKWDSSLGKNIDTDEDDDITIEALWNRRPADVTDDEYKKFYHELYPGNEEPMLWIHLYASDPIDLRGILFFPKTRDKNFFIHRDGISLYSKNVFVTDDMKGIELVPDYMQLLFGVIDTDVELNVSRSYLQNSGQIKKVSQYIVKKVCDKLKSILTEDRKKFEDGWDDIRSFINYGFISDSEKFYNRAKEFAMFKDTDGKYFTFDEYKTLIEANQKDKDDNLVYLYATDVDSQTTYIETAKDKGYSVLIFNEQALDVLALQTLEQKFEKSTFKRVDSDVINRLIDKGDDAGVKFNERQEEVLRESFMSRLEGQHGKFFNVTFADLGKDSLPVIVSQSEWGRRMKDNSKFQSNSLFMRMGDIYTLTLNTSSPLVGHLASDLLSETEEKLKPIQDDIDEKDKVVKEINEKLKDIKFEDQTEEQKKERQDAEEAVQKARQKKQEVYKDNAADNKIISQIIDVALLSAGILKGDALNKFLKRTVEFIK